jgi:phosphoenolpyruvate-protein kinase (PTS system EI component)
MSGQLKGEKVYRGIAVSAGVCRGKILVLHRTRHVIARRELPEPEVAGEVSRFEQSLVKTRQQITEVQRRVVASMSAAEADIFDAHLLMLEDRVLIEEVIRFIREQKVNADFAFHSVSERYVAALSDVQDEYLRERAADLRDLAGRVLDNLLEVKDAFDLRHLNEPCILVSHDLSPSTTAQLDKKFVLGFATDIGGKTSHTAIMARSLGIPAVVGLQTSARNCRPAITRCSTATTAPSSSTRPTRRCLNTASWRKSRRRSGKNSAKSSASPPSRSTARPSTCPRTSRTRTTSSPSSPTARKASACSARNFCSSTATACRARRTNTKSIARWPPR